MANQQNNYIHLASLLIRVGLAAVFIIHGWGKVADPSGIIGVMGRLGIPLPTIAGWIIAIFEFGGGILVLLGLYTRIGAAAIAVVMLGAMFSVKFAKGFVGGWEFDLVLLLMALSLLLSGPGNISVDYRLNQSS